MGDLKWEALAHAYEMMGETVVDPSLWPAVMDLLCDAVGASGGVLFGPRCTSTCPDRFVR